jgi:uncharacterized protein YraI
MSFNRRLAGYLSVVFSVLLLPQLVGPASAQKRMLCVHGVEAPGRLSGHARPSPDSPVVTTFPAKACGLRLAGRCSGTWCQMALGRRFGWVDSRSVGVYEHGRSSRVAKPRRPAPRVVRRPSPVPRVASSRTPEASRYVSFPFFFLVPFGLAPARPAYVADRHAAAGRRCVVDVASWDTLRIRQGPGVDYRAIGGIPAQTCDVVGTGTCNGHWCRVAWRGQRGWVNTRYLN